MMPCSTPSGHRRHGIVLVLDCQVIEDILLLLIHAAYAFLDHHSDLVGKRQIVGHQIRYGIRQQVTVAILVLQPFPVQGGATGGSADQKSTAAHVAGQPDQVPDPLQAEHGIVDEERNRVDAVGGIGGACCNKRRHGAQLP